MEEFYAVMLNTCITISVFYNTARISFIVCYCYLTSSQAG